jgi:hypothetical protein
MKTKVVTFLKDKGHIEMLCWTMIAFAGCVYVLVVELSKNGGF